MKILNFLKLLSEFIPSPLKSLPLILIITDMNAIC